MCLEWVRVDERSLDSCLRTLRWERSALSPLLTGTGVESGLVTGHCVNWLEMKVLGRNPRALKALMVPGPVACTLAAAPKVVIVA